MPSRKSPSADQRRASPWRTLALLLSLTALAFSPALVADYIRLDDYSHLFDNPHLQRRSLGGLAALWTDSYFNLYIPVTYSFWWAATMIGAWSGPLRQTAWLFHGLNLAVHLVNTTLVYFLVGTLLVRRREEPARQDAAADRFLALVSALCFALHPLQVETVAWISELKGELAAMFGLLGLLLHYRSGKRVLPAGCLVIAMLAKPSAIVLPGVLFLVNRILLGLDLRKSITLPGLYALLLLPLVLVTKRLQPDTELDFIPTVGERLQVAADALTFYLAKVLVPYPLAVDYGRTPQFVLHLPGWRVALSLLMLIAAVAAVATALLRPRPAGPGHWRSWVSCGGAVFLLSVAPNLGLVPFGFQQYSTVSDHYLYLALLGGSLAAGGLMVRFGHLALSRRIAAAVLLAFAFLSFWQARLWRSTESLFTHTLKVNPRSHLGYHTVAEEHLREGRFDLAVEWGQRSLALKPDYLPAAVSLGLALARTGDHAKAIDHYRSALARHPSTVGTRARLVSSLHNNLGMLLLQTGQEAEGAAQFRQAIAVFPRSFNARMNLGNLALEQHRYADAIAEYEAAQTLSPSNPLVRQRLEIARQGARPAAH